MLLALYLSHTCVFSLFRLIHEILNFDTQTFTIAARLARFTAASIMKVLDGWSEGLGTTIVLLRVEWMGPPVSLLSVESRS